MSFNNEAKKVRDESLSLGLRYISLRHCVELYSPFGFNRTWGYLEAKCGLKEGENNEPSVLTRSVEYLEKDRDAWLHVIQTQEDYVKNRVKSGLPKPTFKCDQG